MRKLCQSIALFLLISISTYCISGCSRDPCLKNANDYYLSYLNVKMTDPAQGDRYLHFENQYKQDAAYASVAYIHDYEIQSWDELSDSLWAVTVVIHNDLHPEGYIIYNYVGFWDGKYYIMNNKSEIPSEMKDGINLEKYTYPESYKIIDSD